MSEPLTVGHCPDCDGPMHIVGTPQGDRWVTFSIGKPHPKRCRGGCRAPRPLTTVG